MDIKRADIVKVRLPGETPYAMCVEVRKASWMGCILNKLFREYSEFEKAQMTKRDWDNAAPLPELHKFKKYDVIEFTLPVGDEYPEPKHPSQMENE